MSKTDFQNGFALGLASGGVVQVVDTTEMDALDDLIDESGVLESTEGTATEKVEQLLFFPKMLRGCTALSLKACTDESLDYYIDIPNLNIMTDFLRNNKYVKRMKGINTSSVTSAGYPFAQSVIEEIEAPFDLSSLAGNVAYTFFYQAYQLREVRLVKETLKITMTFSSANLSAESVQSIIDGLATVETAQTLTLHADIVLTDDQKATINAKGWTLAQ